MDGAAVAGDPFEVGLAAEVAALAEKVRANKIDVPSLQGGRSRRGYPREFMQDQWSPTARVIAASVFADQSCMRMT